MNTNNPRSGGPPAAAAPGPDSQFDETMHAVEELAEQAKDIARHAEAEMSGPADNLATHAKSPGGQGDRGLASEMAALAGEIGEASGMLDETDQAVLESYARTITGGIERALDARGAGDLTDRLRQFARTRPAAFLGAAVLAGLAAGRHTRIAAYRPNHGRQPNAGESTAATASSDPVGGREATGQFEQGLGSSSDAAANRGGDDRPRTGNEH